MSPGGDPIERLRRVAVVLAVAAFAAVAALAVSLVFFALPQADDFVLAAAGREEGWIQYATGIYRGWSGRWSGHAIIAGVHSTVDLTHSYPLVIAGSLAIHLMGVYLLVRTTLGSGLSTRATFVLAIVAFSLLWSGRPGLSETLYWFSGSVPYQMSVALGIALIAGLSRPIGPDVSAAGIIARAVGWSLLALVVTGMLEIISVAICLILGVGTIATWWARDRGRALWTTVFVVAVVGLAIVLLAPGNETRSAYFSKAQNVADTVRLFGRDVASHGSDWVFDPTLLAATVAFVLDPAIAKLRPCWLMRSGVPWRWIVPAVWLTILAAGFAGPRWATGSWMPIRVVDVNYTLFWIGWFVTVFVWTRGLAESLIRRIPSLRLLEVAALAALVLSVVLRGNVPIAVVDLQDRIPAWHAALEERHQAAREAARDGSRLEVLEVPTKPQLLFVLDLKRRSSHWANLGFAKYFGLESVRVKPPSR